LVPQKNIELHSFRGIDIASNSLARKIHISDVTIACRN
jgi:hypothetical protein